MVTPEVEVSLTSFADRSTDAASVVVESVTVAGIAYLSM